MRMKHYTVQYSPKGCCSNVFHFKRWIDTLALAPSVSSTTEVTLNTNKFYMHGKELTTESVLHAYVLIE